MRSLALRDGELFGLVADASRRALERIVDLCLEEEVHALLVAGDLYDGDMRSMKTATFLVRQLERLNDRGVPVFIIRGNHDAESRLTRELELPPNAHVFTGKGGTVRLEACGAAVHGVSFSRPEAPESLLPKYPAPVAGMFNVGLMHTSLSGAAGHDTYAPCSVGDLVAHGYDYWALGHVHQRAVHAERPHVVMPGMPQGRDIGEAGAKSATLVTVSEAGVSLEERITSEVQFDRVRCGLDGVEDWREVVQRVSAALWASADAASDHAVVRLHLEGETPLAWRLHRDLDLLTEQAAEEARSTGTVWLEKIALGVTPPAAAATGQGDARAELGRIMADLAGEAAFLARAGETVEALVADLPAELRGIFGETVEEREAALSELVDDGVTGMTARLIGAGGQGEGKP